MLKYRFVPELLKAEMVKNKMNAESMSNELGIDTSTFYRKFNGESEFNRQEMGIMRYVLGLSKDDMDSIFFVPQLTETQENIYNV